MEAYSSFARVYNLFMDNAPYDEWSIYIKEILKKNGIESGSVLDLGCGTGNMTRRLARYGYSMTGIDASAEMLDMAVADGTDDEPKIMYVMQDMRELEVPYGFDAVISTCDSVNYVLEPEELLDTFKLVYECLKPGGILYFDFNTEYKYKVIIGDTVIAEDRDEAGFIWDNGYDEEAHINIYDVSLYLKEGELYRKQKETHYQRGYTLEEIRNIIKHANFEVLSMNDEYTNKEISNSTERICVTLLKKVELDK
ncbi:MAG: class I SAM-dependent DNA methyltransferase [Suipraeoptans sp.]